MDNFSEIEEGHLPRSVVNGKEGRQLVPTHSTSVQPNVLLRTGMFSPIGRRTKAKSQEQDLSSDLKSLEICQREGYDTVIIKGERLNIETDFKVWCGIILAFSRHGANGEKIKLSFQEFARMCGYPSKRLDKKMRKQIGDSLERIQGQRIRFRRKGDDTGEGINSNLLLRSEHSISQDVIYLTGDASLWDLYRFDHQVLVSLTVLGKLPRAEVAQCLYLFFVALPQQPVPVSFARMRERLRLETTVKEANRRIRAGLKKLESVGFLTGVEAKDSKGQPEYRIHNRHKRISESNL